MQKMQLRPCKNASENCKRSEIAKFVKANQQIWCLSRAVIFVVAKIVPKVPPNVLSAAQKSRGPYARTSPENCWGRCAFFLAFLPTIWERRTFCVNRVRGQRWSWLNETVPTSSTIYAWEWKGTENVCLYIYTNHLKFDIAVCRFIRTLICGCPQVNWS